MADKQPEAPKKVPPRNDFPAKAALYKNSRALELQNRDPDFVYQNFSTDPTSPAYIGRRLVKHERGNARTGFVMVEPWEVVNSQTDKDVRSLDPRTDQGKPVDTVQRFGTQITCKLPRSEFAKYDLAESAEHADRERNLYAPDRVADGQFSLTTAMTRDASADPVNTLKDAGYNGPGA